MHSEDLTAEVAALRGRLSELSEASLRINQSLELGAVLQDVLDTARALTDARYGAMHLHDDRGWIVDFVGSGGTPEQGRQFWQMPNAMKYQKHIESFAGPLRIADFHAHMAEAGLPEFRPPFEVSSPLPLLSVPILHRGRRLGTISLLDKQPRASAVAAAGAQEGRAPGFSVEDEETLVMFAAQAALVIRNARAFGEVQQARARLGTLVNMAPVGVLVFDAESGAVELVNREARRLVGEQLEPGGSAQEMMAAAVYRDAGGREVSRDDLPVAKALRVGEVVLAEEIIIEGPDGHSVTTVMNATPIRGDQGDVESLVVTVQDMTPLEELERLRAEFLGIVGHELRGPLVSIRDSADILLDAEPPLDPAEIARYHLIIRERADHMRDLISDLIDVVRIETATLAVSSEPLDVRRLLDDARNAYLSAGGRDNIIVKLPAHLPAVMADPMRMTQVVTNLLTNASRNSHETSAIVVDAAVDGAHVAISVSDTGRGVPADWLPYLFEKFLSPEGSDRNRDLGLGLAICKGIVEAHGGRIWAESDGPGLGCKLTFTVPASDQVPQVAPPRRSQRFTHARYPDDSSETRVLAIDDDPGILKLVRDALAFSGYATVVTGDPQHAAALIRQAPPAVVLLDLMLPGTDGFELLTDIVAADDTPVIILSAYQHDDLIARAFELGAVDYMVKPFSPIELAARVKAALRKQADPSERYTAGELAIDYARRQVTVAGDIVDLTPTEYRLLAELSASAGAAVTHDQLRRRVWGQTAHGDAAPMRTAIKNLRHKLGDQAGDPKYIITVSRIGYRMAAPGNPPQTRA